MAGGQSRSGRRVRADLRRSGCAPCWRGSPAACACAVSPGPPSSHAATDVELAAVGRRRCGAGGGCGFGGAGRGVEEEPLKAGPQGVVDEMLGLCPL